MNELIQEGVTVITFDSVTKRYPDGTVAVNALDLVLPEGQITVFVGPSGCGKTTSLRMINRMIEPSSGRILVGGQDVMAQDPAKLRLEIGYVIQQVGLFPHRTILDNIATVPFLLGWNKKKARARAAELLPRVGLPDSFASRFPIQLSGGQQQRVGVARALAADPPYMLMDEPFSAVDPITRESLQQEFLRLQSDLGKTIAFVTHDIDEAIKIGDNVAIFGEGGVLAQFDTPERLLNAPASDFVADFVGRDRGFRGLSFVSAAELPVDQAMTAHTDETHRYDDWVLALDAANRPLGWRRPGTSNDVSELEPLSGTFTVTDQLRLVVDLALISPRGLAVRVDATGAVDGVVSHEDVAAYLRRRRGDVVPTR